MSWLARFWRTLGGRWGGRDDPSPDLPSPPVPSEPLARYLLSRQEFSRSKRTVMASAFMPGPDGRKSVFRITGLREPEVWLLGESAVVKPPLRLHARADITVQAVLDVKIELVPDPPPSRHADLAGWPAEGSERLLAATQLADSAQLRLNPRVYP